MRNWTIAVALAALTACSEAAPPPRPAERAALLAAGEWQVAARVTSLRSTDGTAPATGTKPGDVRIARACIAADGKPAAEMFAAKDDRCTVSNAYVRGGKISMQLSCTRAGAPGQLMPGIDGSFTADTLTARVTTTTYLTGSGDYSMVEELTGKRVGECPAQAATDTPPA